MTAQRADVGPRTRADPVIQAPRLADSAASARGRAFVVFALAYALSYFLRSANAMLAQDLGRDLALDAAQLGLVTGLFFAAFAVAQLPTGRWLDRWSPRFVVSAMMVVAAVGALLIAVAPTFEHLAFGRVVVGFGMAAVLPGAFITFGRCFPPHRVATMSALLVAVGAGGALVAATPLAWLNGLIGWRAVFAGAAVVIVLSALAVGRWSVAAPPVGDHAVRLERGGLRTVVEDRRFWRLAPLAFFVTGTQLAVQGLWAGPYLVDVVGLDRLAAGNVLLLLSIGVCLGAACSGWLADRFGIALVVASATAAFALCQVGLAVHPGLVGVALLFLGFGFCGAFGILTLSHARQLFPAEVSGRAVTAANLFCIGGSFCIQWGLGFVLSQLGSNDVGHAPPSAYSVAFLICAVATALALVWYLPLVNASTASVRERSAQRPIAAD